MTIQECAKALKEQDNYLLITHKRPDGDTLGSAAALCHALQRIGKTAYLYPNAEATENYLPFVQKYFAPKGYNNQWNISVDVGDTGMLAKDFSGDIWLKLDHHVPRAEMGQESIIWTQCAACGELILALITELCGEIDQEEANLLYIAISTDTGCFVYANTTAETHRAVATLLDHGAELPTLNKILFRTKRKERLLLESMIYSGLQSYKDNSINIAVITLDMLKQTGVSENDLDDLASLAGLVKGNKVSVTIREISENPPKSKLSLRTDGSVDASALCSQFGGGGHKMASGCEMSCSPQEAASTILSALEKVWP